MNFQIQLILIVVICSLCEVLAYPAVPKHRAKNDKGENGLSEINKDVKSADVESLPMNKSIKG